MGRSREAKDRAAKYAREDRKLQRGCASFEKNNRLY